MQFLLCPAKWRSSKHDNTTPLGEPDSSWWHYHWNFGSCLSNLWCFFGCCQFDKSWFFLEVVRLNFVLWPVVKAWKCLVHRLKRPPSLLLTFSVRVCSVESWRRLGVLLHSCFFVSSVWGHVSDVVPNKNTPDIAAAQANIVHSTLKQIHILHSSRTLLPWATNMTEVATSIVSEVKNSSWKFNLQTFTVWSSAFKNNDSFLASMTLCTHMAIGWVTKQSRHVSQH